MCGILLSYGIDKENIIRVLKKISHRGPYHHGEFYIDNVAIAMVQLPMKQMQQDVLPVRYQSYHVSYNGELYDKNAINLYSEVEMAIESIKNLKPVNGMFALAAYDSASKSIIIARDEFGIKPIYYYLNKNKEIFIACSEIPPILELISSTKINKATIAEIVAFGTQATEATCFTDINLLEPGNILTVAVNTMQSKRSVLPPLHPEIDNLTELLHESVSACADTFRPGSLLLSDGLDSNLLLTYLKKDITKYNVVVNDDDLGVNQNKYSNLKQTLLNKQNYFSQIEKAISSYAQPCRMSSILMYQALSDHIAIDSARMVITGEGADEFFWGYPRHTNLTENSLDHIELTSLYFNDLEKNLSLLSASSEQKNIPYLVEENISSSSDKLDTIFSWDKKFSLEPLLRRSDHLLMSNTIESRSPFLHFGIPFLAKHLGFERVKNQHGKYPLIALMSQRNPHYVIKNKQHFRAPLKAWLADQTFSDLFNDQKTEILASLGISIECLKKFYEQGVSQQIFTSLTMVAWYEQFAKFLQH